jgi:hypothetical protein
MKKLHEFLQENPELSYPEKVWLTLFCKIELKWQTSKVADVLQILDSSVCAYMRDFKDKIGQCKNDVPALAYLFPITKTNGTQTKEIEQTKKKTVYEKMCDRLDRIAIELEINGYDENLVNERNNILVDKKRIEDEPKYKDSKVLIVNYSYHGI